MGKDEREEFEDLRRAQATRPPPVPLKAAPGDHPLLATGHSAHPVPPSSSGPKSEHPLASTGSYKPPPIPHSAPAGSHPLRTLKYEEPSLVILASQPSPTPAVVKVEKKQPRVADEPLPDIFRRPSRVPPQIQHEDRPAKLHPLFTLSGYPEAADCEDHREQECECADALGPLVSLSMPARATASLPQMGVPLSPIIVQTELEEVFPGSPLSSPPSQTPDLQSVIEHSPLSVQEPTLKEQEELEEEGGKLFWTHEASYGLLGQGKQTQLGKVCAEGDSATLIAKAKDLTAGALEKAHKESMEETSMGGERRPADKIMETHPHGSSVPMMESLHPAGPATVNLPTAELPDMMTYQKPSPLLTVTERAYAPTTPPRRDSPTPAGLVPGLNTPPNSPAKSTFARREPPKAYSRPTITKADGTLPLYENPMRAEWFLSTPRGWSPGDPQRKSSDGPIQWIDAETVDNGDSGPLKSAIHREPSEVVKHAHFNSPSPSESPSSPARGLKSRLGRVLPSFKALSLPKPRRKGKDKPKVPPNSPLSPAMAIGSPTTSATGAARELHYEEIPAQSTNGHTTHRTQREYEIRVTGAELEEPPPLPERPIKSILKTSTSSLHSGRPALTLPTADPILYNDLDCPGSPFEIIPTPTNRAFPQTSPWEDTPRYNFSLPEEKEERHNLSLPEEKEDKPQHRYTKRTVAPRRHDDCTAYADPSRRDKSTPNLYSSTTSELYEKVRLLPSSPFKARWLKVGGAAASMPRSRRVKRVEWLQGRSSSLPSYSPASHSPLTQSPRVPRRH